MRTWRLTWRVFLHSRPQCLRVWGRDWFSWCNFFFFLCGLQINNESGLNAEARSKQKTMGLFSTSVQLPRGCNSYFVNQRGWTAVVWLFLTNGKREKKNTKKPPAYAGFRAPSSHVGSLRLVFIMRAREGQSIL